MAHRNQAFPRLLLNWYDRNKRDLPWRSSNDPYIVWLSEIILQQTRVAQGTPYFNRFMAAYPTVSMLASASEQAVLSLWQGLGYYSRARNLLACAQYIAAKYKGSFPSTYAELVKLKGVGPYTAAAIASISFNEVVPVIDGNVYRVVSRVFGIYDDIAAAGSRKAFHNKLMELISDQRPGDFNQAIMEFGALQCVPANPDCSTCVLKSQCYAFEHEAVALLPVKEKKLKVKNRFLNYLVFENNGTTLFNERKKKDIWQGLHDFYLLEDDKLYSPDQIHSKLTELLTDAEWALIEVSDTFKHVLTHQVIYAMFTRVVITNRESFSNFGQKLGLKAIDETKCDDLPKPILITKFLKKRNCLFTSSPSTNYQPK